ncbi:hypothetical protein TMatcc_008159 [Talaromyces marneffei ATCC 18224]
MAYHYHYNTLRKSLTHESVRLGAIEILLSLKSASPDAAIPPCARSPPRATISGSVFWDGYRPCSCQWRSPDCCLCSGDCSSAHQALHMDLIILENLMNMLSSAPLGVPPPRLAPVSAKMLTRRSPSANRLTRWRASQDGSLSTNRR